MNKVPNILAAWHAWELPSFSSEGHLKAACSLSKYHTLFHEQCNRKSETRKAIFVDIQYSY